MSKTFEGQVMIVTGAAQGIGQRVAELAAQQGARLALVDRSPLVHEVRSSLEKLTDVIAIEADLEQFEGAERAAAEAHAKYGRIDILVNNVGGTIWAKPYEHYAPKEIEAEVRRSLFPTLWGCRAVLPYMLEVNKGSIVNVSSIATRSVNRVPYGAAKGGVNALTACLALENGDRGIRINAVASGGTEAPPRRVPRNPAEQSSQEKIWYQEIVDQTVSSSLMKRYGTLDEQAEAILFLASDRASYITGTVLPVGGGDQG
ncbi:MAG: 1,6-dihydroxycyclohexa-2,4-diene-1-carboxylate dehydrogenase [Comamonadaceae bacterium]|nr:1,6-dihydroxycyclohexa-2,4-diene-1-carboxylate dehydrogenase [Comamonadaceae bacterium]